MLEERPATANKLGGHGSGRSEVEVRARKENDNSAPLLLRALASLAMDPTREGDPVPAPGQHLVLDRPGVEDDERAAPRDDVGVPRRAALLLLLVRPRRAAAGLPVCLPWRVAAEQAALLAAPRRVVQVEDRGQAPRTATARAQPRQQAGVEDGPAVVVEVPHVSALAVPGVPAQLQLLGHEVVVRAAVTMRVQRSGHPSQQAHAVQHAVTKGPHERAIALLEPTY
mmetsp:Transcript_81521/g.253084  ORF Transcript_81521/g.253084 Transcript_81521/m.253084 type:complete len:226 (-) Transcript_81521:390-1067(-)